MSERPQGESPLPPGLAVVRRIVDGALVVAAEGEVDLNTAPALNAAIARGIDQAGEGPCVVDLTGVSFLDSAGLTALLHATVYAEAHHRRLPIVVDSNRPVIRPIQVTGLDDNLALYHTVDEALNASRSIEPS
ncbi:anti-sigma factor antagonist [Labedaea rhizosphaerae]|uniref:anti-sigma factor antagonist n=1 Tax=Labedaea rhizosphaerae TaxID=598644 RepID=UPI001FB6DF25|nr:anti-sigma factor antagonist [Labedaea rhizosphaerae]